MLPQAPAGRPLPLKVNSGETSQMGYTWWFSTSQPYRRFAFSTSVSWVMGKASTLDARLNGFEPG
jgi:hypothetical protein